MEPDSQSGLEDQVKELRMRVRRLEETLASRGIYPQAAPRVAEPVMQTAPILPVAQMAQGDLSPASFEDAPPLFAGSTAKKTDSRSLESKIGSQWFNRVGILAVLIAMAWFLKLAIDNQWIGPAGRVLLGLVAGAGLIAWSERFRAKGYAAFSYSLKAVGSGILYLSLWAAFSLFHLIPSSAAFAAMILVTAFNGFMAWAQEAELLALYGIVGGLSTPVLLSTSGNHEVTLFSYLLLLDIGVLVLVVLRPWSRLLFAAFLGTVVYFGGWLGEYYTDSQAWRTAPFLTCFFLIFAFGPRLIRRKEIDETHMSAWDNLALVVLPVVNAALGFISFHGLIDQPKSSWAGPWLAVAFAAFYLLILRLPERGWFRASPPVLASLHLATAVVFLTLPIPLKAHGHWLTVGWLVEGGALFWVAIRVRSVLLRVLAVLCFALGLVALLALNPGVSSTPIWNARFGSYCVAIAVLAFGAWLGSRQTGETYPESAFPGPAVAFASILVCNALILLAVSLEIHNYWWVFHLHGKSRLSQDYEMYAQFTYSAWFMIFGAILLSVGFGRASAFLRWQALVLLAVAVGKVFVVDVSELSQGYRILSFLGLGVLLLGVSYIYQRDWLNLKGRKPVGSDDSGAAEPGGGDA